MSTLPRRFFRGGLSERAATAAVPVAVAALAFALYFRTAARTITWAHGAADGAELSAVAATLGIAHPPGYPLYTLLGHLFTLLPVGEVGFRMAIFSAVAGAVAAGLASCIVIQIDVPGSDFGARLLGAIGSGLAVATAPMLWSQATVPEVMALSAVFVLALLLALFAWQPGRDGVLLLAAFVLGLALAHHVTIALLGGLCVVYVTARDPGWIRRRVLPLAALAGLAGLSLYLYLPLRALADPPLNWGDPSTLSRFAEHVTARSYQGYFGGRPLTAVLARFPVLARLLIEQFTWPGLALAIVGLTEICRRRRSLGAVLIAYILVSVAFTVLYFTREGEGYALPVILVLGLGLGAGLRQLAEAPYARWLAVVAIIAILGWQLWSFGSSMDVSTDQTAAIYARTALAGSPPNAVVFTDDDEHTFALWYVQTVEGVRPDVVVVDRRALALDWYREQLLRRHPEEAGQVLP